MSEKKEYIERGALMNEIEKHFETIGANAQRLVARFPAADVAPVAHDYDNETEYIGRGALLYMVRAIQDETRTGREEYLLDRVVKAIEFLPKARVAPVVRGECDVCGAGIGLGGGMRIIKLQGSFYIECDSPDSWYHNSESDEIFFCPNCGRKLHMDERSDA